jgi:predicted MPP superfamily phosphohydrolase
VQAAVRDCGIPCFAVPGNHDSPVSLQLLAAAGFTVLINQSTCIPDREGHSWLIIGLDCLHQGQPDFAAALRNAAAEAAAIPMERRVVLAHNPDTLFALPPAAAGFFLAGHFHGGQIYFPFHLEFVLLRHEKIGRMGYRRGPFSLRGIQGYISRGLGCVLFPFRLGSKPELPILDLSAG